MHTAIRELLEEIHLCPAVKWVNWEEDSENIKVSLTFFHQRWMIGENQRVVSLLLTTRTAWRGLTVWVNRLKREERRIRRGYTLLKPLQTARISHR